jgi:hypothetical protein
MRPAWMELALILLMVGCVPKVAQTQVAPTATAAATFPAGKFMNGNFSWEFNAGGIFTSSGPQGSETGTYTVIGNQVVITCQCCGDVKGTYTWTYTGNALIFKAIEDECTNRLGVVGTGQWVKNP